MGKLTGKIPLSPVFSCCPPYRKFIGLVLVGLVILSCSGYHVRGDRPRGIYHRVKSGETLSIIARAYHVDLQELAEINNVGNPDRIETDSVIFIPDVNQILDDVMTAIRPATPPATPGENKESAKIPKVVLKPETQKREEAAVPEKRWERSPADAMAKDRVERSRAAEKDLVSRQASEKPEKGEIADPPLKTKETEGGAEQIRYDKKRFIWPVKGKVVSHFGIQSNRMYYNGIRIAAGEGTAVQAAADGLVIFSAPLKDYGETIIIQHEEQYATVYTYLGIRTVRGESRVKKGDRIAFLGKADDQAEPYLHFEIRYKNKARNPLFFLP
jgi:lipoprotein NlpD